MDLALIDGADETKFTPHRKSLGSVSAMSYACHVTLMFCIQCPGNQQASMAKSNCGWVGLTKRVLIV